METLQTPPGQQGNLPPVSPTPEERKKAIDFAADATKQLITVAAGVITATVIFSKDLNSSARSLGTRRLGDPGVVGSRWFGGPVHHHGQAEEAGHGKWN